MKTEFGTRLKTAFIAKFIGDACLYMFAESTIKDYTIYR